MNKTYYHLDEKGRELHMMIKDIENNVIIERKVPYRYAGDYIFALMNNYRQRHNAKIYEYDHRLQNKINTRTHKIVVCMDHETKFELRYYYSNGKSEVTKYATSSVNRTKFIIKQLGKTWQSVEIEYINTPDRLKHN